MSGDTFFLVQTLWFCYWNDYPNKWAQQRKPILCSFLPDFHSIVFFPLPQRRKQFSSFRGYIAFVFFFTHCIATEKHQVLAEDVLCLTCSSNISLEIFLNAIEHLTWLFRSSTEDGIEKKATLIKPTVTFLELLLLKREKKSSCDYHSRTQMDNQLLVEKQRCKIKFSEQNFQPQAKRNLIALHRKISGGIVYLYIYW